MPTQTPQSRSRTLCPSFLETLQNSAPKKEQFLDSNRNPIRSGNYLSPKGHCYRVCQNSSGNFRFIYSGNFDQGYQNLTPELASTLGIFEGDFSEKIMQLFDLLESQADSRKRPIYECVSPSNGTWANRYKDAKVTPPIPDHAPSSPSCTPSEKLPSVLTGRGGKQYALDSCGSVRSLDSDLPKNF